MMNQTNDLKTKHDPKQALYLDEFSLANTSQTSNLFG